MPRGWEEEGCVLMEGSQGRFSGELKFDRSHREQTLPTAWCRASQEEEA